MVVSDREKARQWVKDLGEFAVLNSIARKGNL